MPGKDAKMAPKRYQLFGLVNVDAEDGLVAAIDNAHKTVKETIDGTPLTFPIAGLDSRINDFVSHLADTLTSDVAIVGRPTLTGEVFNRFYEVSLDPISLDFSSGLAAFRMCRPGLPLLRHLRTQGEVDFHNALYEFSVGSLTYSPTSIDDLPKELWTYVCDLVTGQFVDRNGDAVTSPIDLSNLNLADFQISPAVAGELLEVIIEYFFDKLFRIDIFSPTLFQATLDAKDTSNIQKAKDAIAGFFNSGGGAEMAKDWSKVQLTVSGTTIATDWYANADTRRAHLVLARLDAAYDAAISSQDNAKALLKDPGTTLSSVTPYQAKVINTYLSNILLNGTGDDYADVVGATIRFAAGVAQRSMSTFVGALVRGVSLVSLNNEVLAEVITYVAATSVKKLVEAFTFYLMRDIVTKSDITLGGEKQAVLDELRRLFRLGGTL